ncbi:hypothetical protein FSARC_12285, partial [Fusarium sarcochroum]
SYQYPRLTGENSIRVIELQPGVPGDIITFDLHQVWLEVASFEALSYEWRDKFGTVPVQCDDEQILITPNCKAAMENLRLRSKPRYLWIDAICINQEDDQERNQQVAMMADIFRAAKKVLMWLGDETNTTRIAFEILPTMAKAHRVILQETGELPFSPESVGEDNDAQQIMESALQDDEVVEAFNDLVVRTYWTRAWIFQEIILGGSRGVCISGSQSCEWTVMKSALLAYNEYSDSMHFSNMARTADEFSNTGEVPLGSASWALRELNATDPRDKIFALLGLATNKKKLVEPPTADYTMTVEEVFVHATRYIIDTDCVCTAWRLGIRQSDKAFPRLPSWVPDFMPRGKGFVEDTFADSKLSSGLNIVPRPVTTQTSLKVGGCIVDKVVLKLTITKELDLYDILSCAVHAVARQHHSIYDTYPAGRVTVTDSGREDAASPSEDKYRHINKTNAEALLTTVMNFETLSADGVDAMTQDKLHSLAIGFLTWSLSRDTEAPPQSKQAPNYAQQASRIWSDRSIDKSGFLDFELESLESMEDLLEDECDLVFTENGYFGLTIAGQAEEGMLIALVCDGNQLHLLRKGEGPERYYEYVDQVYLNFLGENKLENVFNEMKLERLEFR